MSLLVHQDHRMADAPVSDPAKKRVMVIAPGHRFSTRDVYENVVSGLQQLDDVEVYGFPFHEHVEELLPLEKIWIDEGREDAAAALIQVASDAAFPRALAFHPDLIIFVTGYVFPQAGAALLGVYTRTAVILTESPYQWETESRVCGSFNWVFTNERTSVRPLQAVRAVWGHPHPERVAYLPHGYDPARHAPQPIIPDYASDVCFIGSPFPERKTLFAGVNWEGITTLFRGLDAQPNDVSTVMDAKYGFVANDEAHRYYASAKIVINHHRQIRYYGHDEQIAAGEAECLNPRVYELAAARVFQICDDSRVELRELFGESIPTYRTGDSADLERVIRYYLAHPRERERLAAEAYRRVQDHSVVHRMRFLLDTVFRGPERNEGL